MNRVRWIWVRTSVREAKVWAGGKCKVVSGSSRQVELVQIGP